MNELIPLRDLVFTGAAGIAIAAACGLRAFLPLLALAVGVRAGFLRVHDGAEWIASTPVVLTLLWATVVELVADKVPAVDHVLDVIATGLRPIAAAVAAWCTFVGVHPVVGLAAALVLGGGAMGVHVAKAKVRLGSSMLTLGAANPLLSLGEDLLAGGLAAMGVLAPLAALFAVGVGLWALARIFGAPRRT